MASTTTHDNKDNEYDRSLPPVLLPPLPTDEDKQDTQYAASLLLRPASFPPHAPASQEASAWAYKVVRGSLYVVGPAVEALAETGHAHCMHHTITTPTAAAASTSLEPCKYVNE